MVTAYWCAMEFRQTGRLLLAVWYLRPEQIAYQVFSRVRLLRTAKTMPYRYRIPMRSAWQLWKTRASFCAYPQFDAAGLVEGHFLFLNDSADYSRQDEWTADTGRHSYLGHLSQTA